MTPCTSSLISQFEYSPEQGILSIVFRSTGETRHYDHFPIELFWDFEEAESKGRFFNERISHGKYRDPQTQGTSGPVFEGEVKVVAPKLDLFANIDKDGTLDMLGKPVIGPDVAPAAEPQMLSPDQAVAIISPKSPKADELTAKLHAMAATTAQMVVTDPGSQARMEKHLVDMTTVRKVLFDIIDPYRAIAYAAYEQIQKLNKSRLDPVDNAIKLGKGTLNVYIAAEQEKARAEQQRLQAIADAEAEADRQRRTDEIRLQAAQEAQETGNVEEAEKILSDETIQAPAFQTYAPRVDMPTSSLPGRSNWKGWVTDMDDVIIDVADGIKSLRETGKLGGHAPASVLKANDTAINALAKANNIHFSFPGLAAKDDRVLITTKRG